VHNEEAYLQIPMRGNKTNCLNSVNLRFLWQNTGYIKQVWWHSMKIDLNICDIFLLFLFCFAQKRNKKGARKKLHPFFVPHVRDDLAFALL